MRKAYEWVVNHRKLVIAFYAVAVIVCAICKTQISVNYDMNDYLPEDSASTKALDLMDEEFAGGVPNARVMVKDVTIPQALSYEEKIEDVDGVSEVTWLDDAVSVDIPLETMDKDTVETYYKDKNALFSVTIDEDKRVSAVKTIRKIIGEDNAMTGSAVSTATATESTTSQISKITVVSIIFVILVLLLTTESWFEPVVVMTGLAVAIIINAGSNIIFGTISFVTNAAARYCSLQCR